MSGICCSKKSNGPRKECFGNDLNEQEGPIPRNVNISPPLWMNKASCDSSTDCEWMEGKSVCEDPIPSKVKLGTKQKPRKTPKKGSKRNVKQNNISAKTNGFNINLLLIILLIILLVVGIYVGYNKIIQKIKSKQSSKITVF